MLRSRKKSKNPKEKEFSKTFREVVEQIKQTVADCPDLEILNESPVFYLVHESRPLFPLDDSIGKSTRIDVIDPPGIVPLNEFPAKLGEFCAHKEYKINLAIYMELLTDVELCEHGRPNVDEDGQLVEGNKNFLLIAGKDAYDFTYHHSYEVAFEEGRTGFKLLKELVSCPEDFQDEPSNNFWHFYRLYSLKFKK